MSQITEVEQDLTEKLREFEKDYRREIEDEPTELILPRSLLTDEGNLSTSLSIHIFEDLNSKTKSRLIRLLNLPPNHQYIILSRRLLGKFWKPIGYNPAIEPRELLY